MYIKLNNEESSRTHCRAKQEVLRILSVSVAVAMQQAKRMRRIIHTGSFIFFHIISQTARFSKGGLIEHKMCVLIFSISFVSNISHSKKI